MDLRFLLVVCVLLVAAELVEGGRGRKSSSDRRASRRNRHGASYVWTRHLGEGNNVQETAYAPTNKRLVYLASVGDSLAASGYNKSGILYDFTGNNSLIFIKVVGGRRQSLPCFLVNTDLTYQGVLNTLASRNGSETLLGPQVSLNGASAPLERDEARVFLTRNPSLGRHCKYGKIVDTSEDAPADENEPTETVKVLTLDSVISLTVSPSTRLTRGSNRLNRSRGQGRGSRRRNN